MRLFAPTGALGMGFLDDSLKRVVSLRPDVIACDAGSTVNVPDQVPVTNGVFSYTGATFNAVGLDNKGCTLVP